MSSTFSMSQESSWLTRKNLVEGDHPESVSPMKPVFRQRGLAPVDVRQPLRAEWFMFAKTKIDRATTASAT